MFQNKKAVSRILIFFLILQFNLMTGMAAVSDSLDIPIIKSYEEFKIHIRDAILSGKPHVKVIISNYDAKLYSIERVIDELEASTPEVGYLFSQIDNGVVEGYTNSKERNLEFDIQYKNNTDMLSDVIVINNVEDFKVAVRQSFEKYEDSMLLKIMDYSKEKYKFGDMINDMLLEYPNLRTGYKKVAFTVFGNGERVMAKLTFSFEVDLGKIKMMRNESEKKAQEIVNKLISADMPDYQKELVLHDYIVENTRYDWENFEKDQIPMESHSIYGALVKGVAVCEGYAHAFKMMLDMVGVENRIVTGRGKNEDHAWNLVKINSKYYQVDTTWDDPVTSSGRQVLRHDYFNLTDAELMKDHVWDLSKYPRCVDEDMKIDRVKALIQENEARSFIKGTLGQVSTTSGFNMGGQSSTASPIGFQGSATESSIHSGTTQSPLGILKSTQNTLKLSLNSKFYELNGILKEIEPGKDLKPQILNERTVVPLRVILEALNGQLKWDEKTSRIDINRDKVNIQLKIKEPFALVNGETVKLEAPATIINDRTFVPLRFISENFGCSVEWIPRSREIVISW